MRRKYSFLLKTSFILLMLLISSVWARKNKVAQSGMAYLGISMGARETAMGDAATASVKGIQGSWHNPAVLADIESFECALNQVDWLVDTKLYGIAGAVSLNNWGVFGIDLTYMDFGEIMGTRRVDKSIDPRGFQFTGEINVQDYAIGFSYARRINDKFAIGVKVKRLHEDLGRARYVTDEYDDPETGEKVRVYDEKGWEINDWGLDFGTVYDIGWKSLTVAMSMQNFSYDMKYWYEEFQTPMTLRMGMSMNMMEVWNEDIDNIDLLFAVDALHPNDHTERIHLGSELVVMDRFAIRGGYKFNHDIESITFGVGVNFDYGGVIGYIDYAYGAAEYFKDINRFSLGFSF